MAKDKQPAATDGNGLSATASTAVNGKAPDRVAFIPIAKIRQNVVALRPVEKETEAYATFAASVKKDGVIIPISVREFVNPDDGKEVLYGLIDGLQRYNAALDAGLTEIAAKITDKNQAEIEETQIIANAHKIETKAAQYATQIARMLERNPTMSIHQLADRLSKTPSWLYGMLGMIRRLHDDIKPMIDDKRIPLTNGINLSKLPKEEQPQWIDKAMTMDNGEFGANVAKRIKEIKEQRKKGKPETPPTFEPVVHTRKWGEVKDEYNNGAPALIALLRRQNLTSDDAINGAKLALSWACMMDPDSQAAQRAKHEADKAKRDAENEARKLERTRKQEAEAQKTRSELEAKIKEREKQAVPA